MDDEALKRYYADPAVIQFNDHVYRRAFRQGRMVVRCSSEGEAKMRMKEQHPELYREDLPVEELLPNSVVVI